MQVYGKGQSLRDVEDAPLGSRLGQCWTIATGNQHPYNENAKFRPKHGVSKGAAAPFADAPEGGEVALGLGKRNGVWQRK